MTNTTTQGKEHDERRAEGDNTAHVEEVKNGTRSQEQSERLRYASRLDRKEPSTVILGLVRSDALACYSNGIILDGEMSLRVLQLMRELCSRTGMLYTCSLLDLPKTVQVDTAVVGNVTKLNPMLRQTVGRDKY